MLAHRGIIMIAITELVELEVVVLAVGVARNGLQAAKE